MGKYSDFDLDLNQVKSAGGGGTIDSIEYTMAISCACLTDYKCTGGAVCNFTNKCASKVSCGCSASDMTACGAAAGNDGLLRC